MKNFNKKYEHSKMLRQALEIPNANKVCIGTQQVVFQAARNIFGCTESLEISLRSRVSILRIALTHNVN